MNSCCTISTKSHEQRPTLIKYLSSRVPGQVSLVWFRNKFTIPFNLRLRGNSKGLCLHRHLHATSHVLSKIWLSQPLTMLSTTTSCPLLSLENTYSLRTHYLKFLDAVFRLIKAELNQCEDLLERIETAEQSATWWSGHLVDIREEVYRAAVENTKKETQVRFQGGAFEPGSLSKSKRFFPK
jgi:hypothetical protein